MSDRHAPPPIPADVREQLANTRAARELLVEQMQYRRLHRLKERQEATYDWVTPYIDLVDRARRDPAFAGPAGAWMRRYGRNYPIYQTETELATYRAGARVLLATNSYAIGYQEGLTSYVVGPGLTYRATRKPDARLSDEAARPLVKACQAAIDEFTRRVQWYGGDEPGLEEELFWRSCEDGEWFLAHFAAGDGLTDVRTVEPEQVTAPPGGDPLETSFGIITPRDDVQRKLAIYVYWGDDPAEGEEWSPDELIHLKRNAKRSMKRGMTDYCFDAYDAFELGGRLTTNMADAAAQQAAIVGIREHESADQGQIQQFVDDQADFTQADPLSPGTQRSNRYYRRGHWEDVQKGLKYVSGPLAQNSPIHIQVLQAVLRAAGRKWQSPEWLISGLHDTSSFASSLTSESPFTRQVLRGQRPIREAHTRTMLIVLKNKADAGRLIANGRAWSWDEVCELVEVQAEAPSPVVRDKLQEAQAAAIEIPLGVDSRQRYAQGQGRDWHQLEQDNREYQDAHGGDGDPLPVPGAGGDDQRPKPPEPPKPPRPSIAEAVLESLLEDARADREGFTGTKTDSMGREYHYVNGRRVASKEDVEKAQRGEGGDERRAGPVPHDAPTDAHVWGDVHDALPADVRDHPPLLEKLRKYTTFAYHATWNFLAEHGHKLAPEILDTAQDFEKISYSKIGKGDGQAVGDPFMASLGVPYSAVSAVVSHAVGAAYGYLSRKARAESLESLFEAVAESDRQAVAEGVAELFRRIFDALGAADLAPTAAEVLKHLAG